MKLKHKHKHDCKHKQTNPKTNRWIQSKLPQCLICLCVMTCTKYINLFFTLPLSLSAPFFLSVGNIDNVSVPYMYSIFKKKRYLMINFIFQWFDSIQFNQFKRKIFLHLLCLNTRNVKSYHITSILECNWIFSIGKFDTFFCMVVCWVGHVYSDLFFPNSI